MPSVHEFRPDWASAPGSTIADILAEQDISVAEFARRMGNTPEQARELIEGRSTITIAIARQLEQVLGASVEFWMSRDFQYRQDIARLHASDEQWLAELPIGDMIRFGWLKAAPHPSDEMEACLHFFGVPSVPAWREAYSDLQEMAAFRTSPSFDSRPAAGAAWLRRGEIQSGAIERSPWEPRRVNEWHTNCWVLTR